jgi:hypothetical protein
MAGGRPSKYDEPMQAKAEEYLTVWPDLIVPCIQQFPSVAGIALFLGIARETVWAWSTDEQKPEFSNVIARLMAEQELILASKGISGEFNSPLCKLFLYKHGHSEKVETKTTGQIAVTVSEQDLQL